MADTIPQTDDERHARADEEARRPVLNMIDRIAKVICPEAWDRDEFRRIVKRTNGGHTTGIDVEASMEEARNAARQTARDVLAEIARPSPMEIAGESVARLGLNNGVKQ